MKDYWKPSLKRYAKSFQIIQRMKTLLSHIKDLRMPVDKVAHITPKRGFFMCIISICLIQIPLSILRSLTL